MCRAKIANTLSSRELVSSFSWGKVTKNRRKSITIPPLESRLFKFI